MFGNESQSDYSRQANLMRPQKEDGHSQNGSDTHIQTGWNQRGIAHLIGIKPQMIKMIVYIMTDREIKAATSANQHLQCLTDGIAIMCVYAQ